MRHLTSLLSFGRAGRLLAAALATLALISAGCGANGSAPDVRKVVDDSAHAAATTRLSHELARQWCPQAVRQHGRALTPRRARACLARAQRAWLRELRREDYDPDQMGRP
jgi:hypothetical protein